MLCYFFLSTAMVLNRLYIVEMLNYDKESDKVRVPGEERNETKTRLRINEGENYKV